MTAGIVVCVWSCSKVSLEDSGPVCVGREVTQDPFAAFEVRVCLYILCNIYVCMYMCVYIYNIILYIYIHMYIYI